MKTQGDILEKIESLIEQQIISETQDFKKRKAAFGNKIEEQKEELFKVYDSNIELKAFFNRIENCENPDGFYLDEGSDLVSFYNIPFDADKYKFLVEYSDSRYQFVQWDRENDKAFQFHGPCITVNWNHDRHSYFIFDLEARKPILKCRPDIEGRESISENAYVAAVIAKYQNKQGVFNDVIVIDNYCGEYLKHLNLMECLEGYGIDSLDDRGRLNDLISNYEDIGDE